MRVCHILLPSVASLALPYYSTLSHKHKIWKKKSYWTWNVCFDFLYNFCLKTFLLPRRIQRDIIINACRPSNKMTRYPWWILIKCEFCKNLPKNMPISNFMKIHSVGAQLFRADGCTDWHDVVNRQFSQFCKRAGKKTVRMLNRVVWTCNSGCEDVNSGCEDVNSGCGDVNSGCVDV